MSELSEYEVLRQQNIARNIEVMKALGLDASDFTAHRQQSSNKDAKQSAEKKKPKVVNKRKFETEEKGVERRSSRIMGQPVDLQMLDDGFADDRVITQPKRRTEADLRGSKSDHDLAEAEHLRWAGRQGKVTIVGTASYKHTLMRVRTMSEARLITRIKVIERAAGQHAVVKMRLFARVLCLEGYDDIAASATEALSRLIIKLGDPEYGPPVEDEDQEGDQGGGETASMTEQEMIDEAIRRSTMESMPSNNAAAEGNTTAEEKE